MGEREGRLEKENGEVLQGQLIFQRENTVQAFQAGMFKQRTHSPQKTGWSSGGKRG